MSSISSLRGLITQITRIGRKPTGQAVVRAADMRVPTRKMGVPNAKAQRILKTHTTDQIFQDPAKTKIIIDDLAERLHHLPPEFMCFGRGQTIIFIQDTHQGRIIGLIDVKNASRQDITLPLAGKEHLIIHEVKPHGEPLDPPPLAQQNYDPAKHLSEIPGNTPEEKVFYQLIKFAQKTWKLA